MNHEKFTVIFLINHDQPDKILLLKRASTKSFAPNYFTGIGGKVGDLPEYASESFLEGAYRELEEETEGNVTKENIKLQEFARCVYESGIAIHYFWGIYMEPVLPRFAPLDGTLLWVTTKNLFGKTIIPTTEEICREWAKRKFSLIKPFTIFVREVGVENTVRLIEIQKVEDRLV